MVQTAAIFLYLLPLAAFASWLGWVAFAVMLAAVIITVWTGVEYVVEALRLRGQGRRQARTNHGQEQP